VGAARLKRQYIAQPSVTSIRVIIDKRNENLLCAYKARVFWSYCSVRLLAKAYGVYVVEKLPIPDY
jgi:hypothetical protein